MRFLLLLASLLSVGAVDWQPRFLGSSSLRHAAFIETYFSTDTSLSYEDRWTLYVSSFDPGRVGQYDYKYYMRSVGSVLNDTSNWGTDYVTTLDQNAYWPNNPDYLPESVAGTEGIVWTSGFLVPSKTDGQLQVYDTTVEPPNGPYNIAAGDTEDFAYHRVVWMDMDADGDLDAVTCRFHLATIGASTYQVLYLENTQTGFSNAWPEHILSTEAGDVHFATVKMAAEGRDYDVIIMTEFFSKKLSIMWTEEPSGDWSDASYLNYRVIDEEADQTFDLLIDDFNRDGEVEVMVSAYDTVAGVGRASVYFFPEDFRTGYFNSTVIAEGFVPNPSPNGEVMSPGTFKTYYPSTAYQMETAADGLPHKPFVMLSGDDDGKMYILSPVSDDRNDWNYEKNILTETGGNIVGKMAIGDYDNDGYSDVIVAGYSVGLLYVYTYAP